MVGIQTNNEALNLQDILVGENIDGLSDYLSLSIENMGNDTRVCVTTAEENPITYCSTLREISDQAIKI